ncbi:hypothetical protein PT310_01075 [Metamycoplasma hyosynoviae]|uniref:hypothetical protein n=1 Tax=Metamycoplasma hyosynoviae TaxID=29559 RepID=UPI00235F1D1F|nr:hypothetical protein [Metamycoplasma hyosynoviae]MDD1378219.1 hypothetical protein [Metamycoplasma hyosynoviae]
MNPEFTPQIPPYQDAKEMYEKNKRSYIPWFIGYLLILTVMFFITMTAILHLFIKKDVYITEYTKIWSSVANVEPATRAFTQWKVNIIENFVYFIAILGIIIWYIINFAKSVMNKDFGKFQPAFFYTLSFITFILIFNIFFNYRSLFNISAWNVAYILLLVNVGIFLFSFVIFYIIKRIVGEFIKLRILLNSKEAMGNGQFFNFDGSGNFNKANDINLNDLNSEPNSTLSEQANKTNADFYKSNLNSLSLDKLIIMAQKLNIYGAESFSKEQLIEKISHIFENDNKQTSSRSSTPEISEPEDKPKKDDGNNTIN